MKIEPVGVIYSPFEQAAGTPIQPAFAKGAEGHVEVFPEYAAGLKDLEGFERIWLIYYFDRVIETKLTVKPFMDEHERGLFATRAPCRPNPIGMSSVKLIRIQDRTLFVSDIDVLNKTPLLDIKPYVPKFDSFDVERIGWISKDLPKTKLADDRFYKKQGD